MEQTIAGSNLAYVIWHRKYLPYMSARFANAENASFGIEWYI